MIPIPSPAGVTPNAHASRPPQLASPEYRSFLSFMCPPGPNPGAAPFPPDGEDPRACPRPVLGVWGERGRWENQVGGWRLVRGVAKVWAPRSACSWVEGTLGSCPSTACNL
jgi:hypothetical protein